MFTFYICVIVVSHFYEPGCAVCIVCDTAIACTTKPYRTREDVAYIIEETTFKAIFLQHTSRADSLIYGHQWWSIYRCYRYILNGYCIDF